MADETLSLAQVVTSADELQRLRKSADQQRSDDLREWALNREFYKGNQWVFWNRVSQKVESLPVDDGDKPRYKVRLKNNRIKRGVQRYVAQMTKNKPMLYAVPESTSDRDRQAAKFAEGLYEHLWRELNITTELQRGLMYAALSQGYLKVSYDPLAGRPIRHIIDPHTGAPIDGPLAELLLEQVDEVAGQMGIPAEVVRSQVERITYEGEISVEALPGENVIIDPTAPSFEKAKWAICIHNMTPDEVKARWGKQVTPDAVPTEQTPGLMWQTKSADKRPKSVRRVFCGYFLPSPTLPKGKYIVWTEDPNEILYQGDWPFPHRCLPLIKLPGHESTNGPLDIPPTTDARPLQKELNRTLSQIVEHKNLTLRPQMVAPVGSLRTRLTAEPGAVLEYQPVAGLAPEWRPMPNIPAYVIEHMGDIKAELDDCFNALPNQRDQLPARLDGPGGIDLIMESVADQLLPPIRRLEEALCKLGEQIASLAQHFYSEQRTIQFKGPNGSLQAKKFMAADLAGGFSFHAQAGSALPRTRQGIQERVEFLLQNQLIDPQTALKYLDMPDMVGLQAQIEADEDMALREHDKLIQGVPINPLAVQQAIQQVNDPQQQAQFIQQSGDGNPEAVAAWAQQTIQQAMVQPTTWENLQVHQRVHQAYMASPEFESLPPDAQQRFIDHYNATYAQMMQMMLAQPSEPPKISFALKGTTSAPVAGEILRKAGIQVDDDQVAEPPLDTWVTDDITKPAAQETANTHLDDMDKMLKLQQAQEQHAMSMAKAAHETALASHRVSQAQDEAASQAQDDQRAEELHREKLRQMRQPATSSSNGR